MAGLFESATAIMSASERRLEIAAQNVANISTPGYKRLVGFAELLGGRSVDGGALPTLLERADASQGKLSATGNPLDLAIGGDGYFPVRLGETVLYVRQGQFRRADDGTVVTAQGHVLQQAEGGDLILRAGAVEIAEDGAVIQDGRPLGRIAVCTPAAGGTVPTSGGNARGPMEEVAAPLLRAGMVESSNVSAADEMTSVMAATRQAESGARLAQLYDELMGRALTSFGQGGR